MSTTKYTGVEKYEKKNKLLPGTFFLLNSAEHEICPANKSQITNNCKFFLAKQSWALKFLC